MRPWLALWALALQLVAGFGHFHPEDYGYPRGSGRPAVSVAAAPAEAPMRPAGRPLGLPTHDDCAVCAAQHLLGGSLLPDPPPLAAPAATGTVALGMLAEWHLAPAAHLLFETRGPPAA